MTFKLTDALSFLEKLLSFPSVEEHPSPGCPFGKPCADALDFTLTKLSDMGFITKNMDNYCGYATIGDGELFDVLCHLDVVPAGDNWKKSQPFTPTFKDGKLYARGALDNKGPLVAVMLAVARIIEEGKPLKRTLRIILGCDEESGWKCMEHFQKHESFAEEGFSPDGDFPVINCEKGIVYHTITLPLPKGIKEIVGGERANIVPSIATVTFDDNSTITATGTSAHGSHPEKGDNAIVKLIKMLPEQYKTLKQELLKFEDYYGRKLGLNLFDEKSGSLTLNLGTIKTVGNKIVCEADIRYPVSYDMDTITDILGKNLNCDVERGFYHLPLYLSPQDPLVKTLLDAYKYVTGEYDAAPIAIGGGTYARCLKRGVAFGPCFKNEDAKIHEADEYISLDSFLKMSDIYYTALNNIIV